MIECRGQFARITFGHEIASTPDEPIVKLFEAANQFKKLHRRWPGDCSNWQNDAKLLESLMIFSDPHKGLIQELY